MDYVAKFARLEHLKDVVERYSSDSTPTHEKGRLHQQICETYGEVADAFDEVVGRQSILVPPGNRNASTYPNYFEADFLLAFCRDALFTPTRAARNCYG
jgi:hypothetical protein